MKQKKIKEQVNLSILRILTSKNNITMYSVSSLLQFKNLAIQPYSSTYIRI